jgi:hypothetical protein
LASADTTTGPFIRSSPPEKLSGFYLSHFWGALQQMSLSETPETPGNLQRR